MTNRISFPAVRTSAVFAGLSAATLMLVGCEAPDDAIVTDPTETPAVDGAEADAPTTAATNSIFDQEAEVEPAAEILEPLTATIAFAKNGADISPAGLATIKEAGASDQFAKGGPITLRGHGDAGGSERVNLRVSRERAEAVRDVLVKAGVAPKRITIIAFGEQNPIEPNALADGTPNEAGRAANRRVELAIAVPNLPGKSNNASTTAPNDKASPAANR